MDKFVSRNERLNKIHHMEARKDILPLPDEHELGLDASSSSPSFTNGAFVPPNLGMMSADSTMISPVPSMSGDTEQPWIRERRRLSASRTQRQFPPGRINQSSIDNRSLSFANTPLQGSLGAPAQVPTQAPSYGTSQRMNAPVHSFRQSLSPSISASPDLNNYSTADITAFSLPSQGNQFESPAPVTAQFLQSMPPSASSGVPPNGVPPNGVSPLQPSKGWASNLSTPYLARQASSRVPSTSQKHVSFAGPSGTERRPSVARNPLQDKNTSPQISQQRWVPTPAAAAAVKSSSEEEEESPSRRPASRLSHSRSSSGSNRSSFAASSAAPAEPRPASSTPYVTRLGDLTAQRSAYGPPVTSTPFAQKAPSMERLTSEGDDISIGPDSDTEEVNGFYGKVLKHVARLNEANEAKDKEIVSLRESLRGAQAERNTLSADNMALKHEMESRDREAREEIARLKNQLARSEATRYDTSATYSAHALEMQVAQANSTIQSLRQQLTVEAAAKDNLQELLRAETEARKQAERDIDREREFAQLAASSNASQRSAFSPLQVPLTPASVNGALAHDSFASANSSVAASQIVDLELAAKRLSQKVDSLTDQLDTKTRDHDSLRTQVQSLKHELLVARTQLETFQSMDRMAPMDRSVIESQLSSVKDQLAAALREIDLYHSVFHVSWQDLQRLSKNTSASSQAVDKIHSALLDISKVAV